MSKTTALDILGIEHMAKGRMINKKISLSEKVADLSLMGKLLYTWMIPHADDVGFLQGSARTIKGAIFPLEDFTIDEVRKELGHLVKANLIKLVSYKDKKYFYITDFEKNQTLKKDRQPQTVLEFTCKGEVKESWNQLQKLVLETFGNQMDSNWKPIGMVLEPEVKGSEVKRSEDISKTTVLQGSTLNGLLEKFKPLNPMYAKFYANKTERAALEELVKLRGFQWVSDLLDVLPDLVSKPYYPSITKPTELLRKLGTLQQSLEKDKNRPVKSAVYKGN